MKRRDALKILTAMPAIASVARADLQPTDVLVMEAPGPITMEIAADLRKRLQEVFPHNKIVVLGDGLTLKVVRDFK